MAVYFLLLTGGLLCFKHFLGDGVLQTSYQYINKAKFMHPGGLIHAGIHGLFTMPAILIGLIVTAPHMPQLLALWLAVSLGITDMIVHYTIDYGKENLTRGYGWIKVGHGGPDEPVLSIYNTRYFWALVGDQCLHFATYLALMAAALTIANLT